MSDLINTCYHKAAELHATVGYGDGLTVLDQVVRSKDIINQFSRLEGQDKEVAMAAALLHKSLDPKQVKFGQALTIPELEEIAGPQVALIVQELSTEPKDKSLPKSEQWANKAKWAETLSPVAQEILMAEKMANFETTRDRMKKLCLSQNKPESESNATHKSKVSWHHDYLITRVQVVDVLASVNPQMYFKTKMVYAEAMAAIYEIEQKKSAFRKKMKDQGR